MKIISNDGFLSSPQTLSSNSDRIRRNGRRLPAAGYFFGLITQVWGDFFFDPEQSGGWEIKFWNTFS